MSSPPPPPPPFTTEAIGRLVPAEAVFAVYDDVRRVLTISAKGAVFPVSTGIHFARLPLLGGLKYQLIGYGYRVMGDSKPHEVSDQFPIDTLPGSGGLTVETDGKEWDIDIKHLGLKPAPLTPAKPGQLRSVPPTKTVTTNQNIVTREGEIFQISQSDKFTNSDDGTVTMSFDQDFLTLKSAEIQNGRIVWSFTAQKLGHTEVDVYVGQMNPPFVYRVPHQVAVLLGDQEIQSANSASFSVLENSANGRH